jgi:hypothetical protein
MARKCIRILTTVMMEFFVLILDLQANNLACTSFSHSSLPNRHVHSFNLDGTFEDTILQRC